MGDLCDIYAHTRGDHVTVVAEPRPSRGIRSPLGIITVERVRTLRPQFQPPYLSGKVRFVESYADFDQNGVYRQQKGFFSKNAGFFSNFLFVWEGVKVKGLGFRVSSLEFFIRV